MLKYIKNLIMNNNKLFINNQDKSIETYDIYVDNLTFEKIGPEKPLHYEHYYLSDTQDDVICYYLSIQDQINQDKFKFYVNKYINADEPAKIKYCLT